MTLRCNNTTCDYCVRVDDVVGRVYICSRKIVTLRDGNKNIVRCVDYKSRRSMKDTEETNND